jgi:serine/threonine protein phosphatase 1
MRILAISDIHGCSRALLTLLATVEVQPEDLVITLGDYVDRGPSSFAVIERLLALRNACQLVTLRGNHDQMMLNARQGIEQESEWLVCGGQETLDSYAPTGQAGALADVPERHWKFLETGCVTWFETETHFFVHANAYPDLPLAEQPEYMLLWERFEDSSLHVSGKVMVCGHTAQKSGVPLNRGYAVCIDTWVYGDGWLTCLDVSRGWVWQANQRGQVRSGWLDDFAAGS